MQGRITLLMGPPGSGKSVFLKTLGGRMKPCKELRMEGSIKYNGCTQDEFNVERTVGLVDQHDSVPPPLSLAFLIIAQALGFTTPGV